MATYFKAIATFKGTTAGYTGDGTPPSGMVKCEQYGTHVNGEVTLVNLSPLSEGRYVYAFTDGEVYACYEDPVWEQEGVQDLRCGFLCVVYAVHKAVVPVCMATYGQRQYLLQKLSQFVEGSEFANEPPILDPSPLQKDGASAYQDEAIAEVNYYEQYEVNEAKDTPYEDSQKEKAPHICPNEEAFGTERGTQKIENNAETCRNSSPYYLSVQREVEDLFLKFPRVKALEQTIEGSKFVKISYDGVRYYVFGVMEDGNEPTHFIYGVEGEEDRKPTTFRGYCTFVPCKGKGYWLLYQDALTGKQVEGD